MPSVSGGRALTGLFLRNAAVADEFLSPIGRLGSEGALNWKNSYSATHGQRAISCPRLILDSGAHTARHSPHARRLNLRTRPLEHTPRTRAQAAPPIGIPETAQEKRHVVLPGYAPERTQINLGHDIPVPILAVANLELAEVGLVVHVPAEDDGAETEAGGCDGEEFGLGHEFAAQRAVDVAAGDFDAVVILEEVREVFEGEGGGVGGDGHFGVGRLAGWTCGW